MSAGNGALAAVDDRTLAPFGRRRAVIVATRQTGGYRVFSALDEEGPLPDAGQFYMLTSAHGWGDATTGRPYLPRAFSVALAEPVEGGIRLDFLAEAVGPGTENLIGLTEGDELWITGPLGRPFSLPASLNPDAAGAVLVGGGIGLAPLAIWRRRLVGAGIPTRTLLGFRDREHAGGLELFDCSEIRLASEDGHAGHRGYVTDLLAMILEGPDAAHSAVIYACGPPAMLEATRALCARARVSSELAMESPMACGFGACYGCAVPLVGGGYARLCVDGPVVGGDEIETAVVAGSGHR